MKSKSNGLNKYKVPIIIIGSILLLVVIFIVVANYIIVFHDDCGSPCNYSSDESDKFMACPAVCVKMEQSLWEAITGQPPHSVGF